MPWKTPLVAAGFEAGSGPQAKECRQQPEVANSRDRTAPRACGKEHSPADTRRDIFWTSDLQYSKIINMCVLSNSVDSNLL